MPEETELRTSAGFGRAALIGVPSLVAGVAVMALPWWGLSAVAGEVPPPSFALPFGGLFTLVGTAIAFGRRGTVIDRRGGTVTTWWGLPLAPLRSTERPLADFARVEVGRVERRAKQSTIVVHPVRLYGRGAALVVHECADHEAARALGERVARVTGLDLHDLASGSSVVREAGTVDESLRDRARRSGRYVDAPVQPRGARCTIDVRGDEMVIETPALGFQRQHLLMVVAGLAFSIATVAVFVIPFWDDFGPGLFAGDVWAPGRRLRTGLGCLVAFFVVGPALLLGARAWAEARTRDRLTVAPRALVIERLGLPVARSTRLAAEDLEELEVQPGRGPGGGAAPFGQAGTIVARSDRTTAHVGLGLDLAELEWLRDTLHFVLTAG